MQKLILILAFAVLGFSILNYLLLISNVETPVYYEVLP